jgi:inhibitor of cysteine peptidase
MLTLGAHDAGSRYDVTVGDVVAIELEEHPTTGYRWQLGVDHASVRVVDDTFANSDPSVRGAPGRRRVTLQVLRAGTIRVTFRKIRSWQPDDVVERFDVQFDAAAIGD